MQVHLKIYIFLFGYFVLSLLYEKSCVTHKLTTKVAWKTLTTLQPIIGNKASSYFFIVCCKRSKGEISLCDPVVFVCMPRNAHFVKKCVQHGGGKYSDCGAPPLYHSDPNLNQLCIAVLLPLLLLIYHIPTSPPPQPQVCTV